MSTVPGIMTAMTKGKRKHFRFKMMRIEHHLRHKLGHLGAAMRPRQDPDGEKLLERVVSVPGLLSYCVQT